VQRVVDRGNAIGLTLFDRARIDRMSEATGGVSRLVSWPRKKPTKTLVANSNVGLRLAA
jgi:hypothetical protein